MKAGKISMILSIVLGITTLMLDYASAVANNGWQKDNGNWYYYENGSMARGWKQSGGSWYYLNSDGTMKTGWIKDAGNWYYLNDNGSMAVGWQNINGSWYYLQSSGAMKTGWLNDGGTWYYLNDDGSMAHDTVINSYTLDSSGAYVTGNSISTSNDQSSASGGSSSESKKNYTFIEGLNKFCSDSSSIILSSEDKNTNATYSPVSFYMALAVLSEGADNATKADILNTLNIKDADKLSEECMKLYEKEIFNSKNGKCTLADSVWIDDDNNDVEFNEDTLKKIENDYKAGIFKGDLQSMDTAEKISTWIMDHTGGLLGGNPNAFVSSDKDEVMNIFNAVYFKDRWKDIFDRGDTLEGDFALSDGSKVKSDFMRQSVYSRIYESSNGYKSGSMSFENGHKMMFILPDEGKSVYDIINDKNKLNEALSSLSQSNDKAEMHDVYYKVPKFKFSSNINLNDCAVKLGLKNIYGTDKTDFTKFSEKGGLYVSNIHQEATVSIDEDGGEAAAYTQIGICDSAYNPDAKLYDMILDRPFIFAITDKDETPLFVGVLNNPQK